MKKAVKAVILILMSMGWIHAQSISISSPYPMMTWHTGEEYEIKWSSTGQMDNMVRIVLRRNDTPFRVIAHSESNDGSYKWTIPPDIPEGSYVMRVRTNPVQYPSVTGNSGTFFIKPPVVPKIEVYKPDGSSHWLKGQPYSIRWSQTKSLGQYVQIQLFKVDETTEVKLFPSLSAINNMGAYKWTVPLSVTPGNYKIKVRAMGTDVADFSAPFEIRGAEKFIAITEPEPWAGLCIGRNRTIRWASGGLQGTVNLELLTLAGKVLGSIAKYVPVTQGSFDWKVGRYKTKLGRWYDFSSSLPGGGEIKPDRYYLIKIISPSGGIHVVSKRYLLMRCPARR